SFGADFLETWISNVGYAKGFGRMHSFRDGRAGTFIHVEPRQSLTASNADTWVRNAPGTEHLVALAVLKTLAENGAVDKRFAEAAKKVGLVVSFANRPDETTALAHVVLPDTHWLESWGDYAPREGVVGVMQPAMMPIRDARPFGDVMLAIGRAALGITEEGK